MSDDRTIGIQMNRKKLTKSFMMISTLGQRLQHGAQCCRNIRTTFRYTTNVCLGFQRIHRNVDKKWVF